MKSTSHVHACQLPLHLEIEWWLVCCHEMFFVILGLRAKYIVFHGWFEVKKHIIWLEILQNFKVVLIGGHLLIIDSLVYEWSSMRWECQHNHYLLLLAPVGSCKFRNLICSVWKVLGVTDLTTPQVLTSCVGVARLVTSLIKNRTCAPKAESHGRG